MECINPRYLAERDIVVPCGNCPFCSATRRSDWATRLHYESKLHYSSKFVTLTYANPHLTFAHNQPQLVKADLQNYFKRLRKKGYKLRYYACGEYGSKTFRPHYHVILFGEIPEADIRNSWPLGQVHIGSVTQASIAYCLGYIVNGKGWKMRHYRERPFCTMSRKPGIGANYLTNAMKEWHKSGRKNYVMLDGNKRHLPRYYKGKIFSKIDHVRIAVAAQKEGFKKLVEWIRQPSQAKMRDPLSYRKQQMIRLARSINLKCKENLTI